MAFLVYIVLATGFMLGALYFVSQGQRRAREEAVEQRLAAVGVQTKQVRPTDWLTVRLERAGITLEPTKRKILGLTLVFVHLLSFYELGFVFTILLAAGVAVTGYGILTGLYSRRQGLIIEQLPRLLDQVVRMMRTGKTIGDSFFIATRDAEEPLKQVMEKLQRSISLGMTIPEAFNDLADTYDLKELHVLALGVNVNARYGGSLVDLLNNVIQLIQEREKSVRQLKAMTGETRASAVVLCLLPILIGGFMTFSNPDYLFTMIEDPDGKSVLIGAAVMQILGMFVMWRMLRSI